MPSRIYQRMATTSALAAALFVFWASVSAGDSVYLEPRQAKQLHVTAGKSVVLRSSKPIKRVSEPATEVAAAIALSPYEIYVTGKAAGTTTLILWDSEGISAIYDLEVSYDITLLKQKLHQVLPNEKNLRVIATQDSISLSGKVSNSANLSHVLAVAEAYAPKGKIHNLLEVGGVHQVMLEVRVAEMARSTIKRLGINFNWVDGQEFGVSLLGGLSQLVKPEDANIATGPLGLFVSPAVNALLRFQIGSATWTGIIDALHEDGIIKILAEPTLTALSGQPANFLVGGEVPIPIPQGLGAVGIEYKPFGVGLSFTPVVLSGDRISIEVAPDVSEVDFRSSITIQGYTVPSFTTRRASTTVELGDGQSFAIAGLLSDNVRDNLSKYPVLGSIPILGALFRSRNFQKSETELVIVVTPHLVKPFDLRQQPLPTDYYIEPDDTELYLLGLMEGRPRTKPEPIKGELDGDFGHAVPAEI